MQLQIHQWDTVELLADGSFKLLSVLIMLSLTLIMTLALPVLIASLVLAVHLPAMLMVAHKQVDAQDLECWALWNMEILIPKFVLLQELLIIVNLILHLILPPILQLDAQHVKLTIFLLTQLQPHSLKCVYPQQAQS